MKRKTINIPSDVAQVLKTFRGLYDMDSVITGSQAFFGKGEDLDIAVSGNNSSACILSPALREIGFACRKNYELPFDWGGCGFNRMRRCKNGEMVDVFIVTPKTLETIEWVTERLVQVVKNNALPIENKNFRVQLFHDLAKYYMEKIIKDQDVEEKE